MGTVFLLLANFSQIPTFQGGWLLPSLKKPFLKKQIVKYLLLASPDSQGNP
jgi:hypothetical protein